MKKLIIFSTFLWVHYELNAQQNVVIQTGTNITTTVNATVVLLNCNLQNNSNNANFSNCLLTESGSTNVTIGGTGILNFKELTINKTASTLLMNSNLSIQSKLNFQSGNVDLNGNVLSLAPLALLIGEKSSSRLIGENGGYASIDVQMNNPNFQNPGNLGLSVKTSANMGLVNITRGHKIQSQNGFPFSMKRHYNINSSNGPNFQGTLRFAYFDEEFGVNNESFIQIWSSNNGTSWLNRAFTNKNVIQNYIESSSLTVLEKFTLADPAPGIVAGPTLELRNHVINQGLKPNQLEANLYPNPLHEDQSLWLELTSNVETKGVIQMINPLGQIIKRIPFLTNNGTQKIALNINDFGKGIYVIQIASDDCADKNLKLIIQ
ncbi:MAG: T9SS type A sorting domain-containing protein [Saprospiraceae bacterium]|nr:T9SS type A sorting domain-containing protein [Saprospiraceae bacterium]